MRCPRRCQANNPDNPRFYKACGVRRALAGSPCRSETRLGIPTPPMPWTAWGTATTTATRSMTSSPRTTKPFVSIPLILGLSVDWRPRSGVAPRPPGGVR
jgi:hypothetical protein